MPRIFYLQRSWRLLGVPSGGRGLQHPRFRRPTLCFCQQALSIGSPQWAGSTKIARLAWRRSASCITSRCSESQSRLSAMVWSLQASPIRHTLMGRSLWTRAVWGLGAALFTPGYGYARNARKHGSGQGARMVLDLVMGSNQSLQATAAAPSVFNHVGDSLLPPFVGAQSPAAVPELSR